MTAPSALAPRRARLPAVPPGRRWRFSVTDFERMARQRLFPDDARFELVGGEVVAMPPPSPLHAAITDRLTAWFVRHLGERATVRNQGPLVLDASTLVVPDLTVAEYRADFYAAAHPRGPDTHLVIEVARTTLRYDERVKLPRYAAAGVPEVWIVDVERATLHVHREPARDGYAVHRTLGRGDAIAPAAFPDVQVPVDAVLGAPPRRKSP